MKAPSSSYASTSSHLSLVFAPFRGFNSSGPNHRNSVTLLRPSKRNSLSLSSRFKSSRLVTVSASNSSRSASSGAESASQIGSSEAAEGSNEAVAGDKVEALQGGFHVGVGNPSLPIPSVAKLSLSDQAFFLLAFIACTVFLLNRYSGSHIFAFLRFFNVLVCFLDFLDYQLFILQLELSLIVFLESNLLLLFYMRHLYKQ